MDSTNKYKSGDFMITIKDFARQQGCGESIVYRHIRNHREELGDRVQKLHGRTWLTDEGVDYIKNLMTQHMAIEEKAAPEVISLQKQIAEQKVTIEAQKSIIDMLNLKFEKYEEEKKLLAEAKRDKELLEGFLQDANKEIDILNDEKAEIRREKDEQGKILKETEETLKTTSQELSEALQREEIKDKQIEELESRTFGDYLKDLFRKKGK